ncbi:MAG: hypothetical protein DKT66_16550 [Candidatus Melainabacteria bacterium]|nr:MAG: hypothetical protein DKT66_16550 [Candidatus Melainabacteria bacterium]
MVHRVNGILLSLGLLTFCAWLIPSTPANETSTPALTVSYRSNSKAAKEIVALVARQEKAWNKGDLEAFLNDYLRSPQVTYVSNGNVKRGYDAIREHYLKRYGNSKASMGQLRLSDLEVTDIGDKHVLCIGKFTVFHHAHVPIYGRFSLIFVKTKGEWKIMYDHSSQ